MELEEYARKGSFVLTLTSRETNETSVAMMAVSPAGMGRDETSRGGAKAMLPTLP